MQYNKGLEVIEDGLDVSVTAYNAVTIEYLRGLSNEDIELFEEDYNFDYEQYVSGALDGVMTREDLEKTRKNLLTTYFNLAKVKIERR